MTNKEEAILGSVARRPSISQRELAKTTGISLGLINVILKKFIHTGHIQVTRLNKRKMKYLLTPQGFLETVRKTHKYATQTIQNHRRIQIELENLLKSLHQSGYDYFSIYGDGGLKDLLESVFRQCLEEAPVTLGEKHRYDPRAVVLNITTDSLGNGFKGDVVNVLEKLSAFSDQPSANSNQQIADS